MIQGMTVPLASNPGSAMAVNAVVKAATPVPAQGRARILIVDEDRVNSYGGGCQLGIQKDIGPVSLGATYISRQYTTRFNRYDDLMPYSLDIPQMTQIGMAYSVSPHLRLLADYKYINWAGLEQLGNAPEEGGFGWVDQHVMKVGTIWDVTQKLTLRTGYSHGISPIRSNVVFANSVPCDC